MTLWRPLRCTRREKGGVVGEPSPPFGLIGSLLPTKDIRHDIVHIRIRRRM